MAQSASEAPVPRPAGRPDGVEDAPEASEEETEPEISEEETEPADTSADTGEVPVADEAREGVDAGPEDAEDAIVEAPPIGEIPLPEARPEEADESPVQAEPIPEVIPDTPTIPEAVDDPPTTETLRENEPAVTPEASVEAAAAVADAVACEAELAERGVVFTVEPTISEGSCGVLRPVNVERLSSGVAVSPDTQLLCRAALALDQWMSRSVVPAAESHLDGHDLTEFRHQSTYVCRTRASESGISEHARGSAVDIGSFVFADGSAIPVEAQESGSAEALFQRAVRDGACGPFSTVLGPGTDPDHATHFHLDIAARRNNATYCR
ncbi:MAG TPA: extensin family protein [Aurantimonas sp.]|nr:extensin family protein [Aurantimonas sp.]